MNQKYYEIKIQGFAIIILIASLIFMLVRIYCALN